MNSKSFRITGSDVFTAFQVIMAYCFAVPQIEQMQISTRGVTINWLLCAFIFIALNLLLSARSCLDPKTRNRSTIQATVIYANWVVLLIPLVWIAFLKCAWTRTDTLIFILVLGSAVAVSVWGKLNGRAFSDTLVRGILIGLFRVVPHLYLSYCILHASHADIKLMTVLSANVTAIARIITLRGQKNLRAVLWAEIFNETSWLIVTVLWLIYR